MDFDSALGGAEFGPWKDVETEIYGRGVKRVPFVLEAESMMGRMALASGKQLAGRQVLVGRIRLDLIDSGKRGLARAAPMHKW